jgi:hypothetical protein
VRFSGWKKSNQLKPLAMDRLPALSVRSRRREICVYMNFAAGFFATRDSCGCGFRQGYDDSENAGRRYPVSSTMNDGQNLFEASTSFNGVEWQVDETGDRLIREGVVPPMIFVGIDNTGRERIREYMPHRSLHPVILRVHGTRYPAFLFKEVMPFMAQHLPRSERAGEYGTGRVVAGRSDCALHRRGASGRDWAIAAGESFAVGFEPAVDPAEPRSQALAGASFPGDRNCRSRDAEIEIRAWWTTCANWRGFCGGRDWTMHV